MPRRSPRLLLFVWLLVATFAAATSPPVEVPDSDPATLEQPQEPESPIGDDILPNLTDLLKNSLAAVGGLMGRLFVAAAIGGALGAFLGAAIGLLLFSLIRRVVPGADHRVALALWAILFAIVPLIGGGWAGAWIGGGRAVAHEIEEERIVDRMVASIYFATVLDQAAFTTDSEIRVDEFVEQLQNSEAMSEVLTARFGELVGRLADNEEIDDRQRRALGWLADSTVANRVLEGLDDADPRIVIAVLAAMAGGPEEVARLEAEYPGANVVLAAFGRYTSRIRVELARLVRGTAIGNAAAAGIVGLGGPLLLVALGALIGRLLSRRRLPDPT